MAISLLQSAGSKGTSDRHAFCARIAADVSQSVMAPRHRVSGELVVSYARAAFPEHPAFSGASGQKSNKASMAASALVQASRRKRPIYRSFCKKSLLYAGAPKPAGRGARGRGVPENRDSQARRVVRSHTHGEPILPPNFRRRVAGVPPVRREALRVGFCSFSRPT